MLLWLLATAYSPVLLATGGEYMDCGVAALCGVLALETGLGPGAYQHAAPSPHGLWPEMGSYGSSACRWPSGSDAAPSVVYPCYSRGGGGGGGGAARLVAFEGHEWTKHGTCAGVRDANDYFTQVCDLAARPIELMAATRASGGEEIGAYVAALERAGVAVFRSDAQSSQLLLSACSADDGRWKLAPVERCELCARR